MITAAYGVPLHDLLALDDLGDARVLAGGHGLDRLVTGVAVMEVPGVLDHVRPHEWLVTGGYPLASTAGGDSGALLVTLVRELARRDLAGVGIRLGRYLQEVPGEVLALADELALPVVALPAELAFDDLLRRVYLHLNQHHADTLERIDALHTALSGLVLAGGGLERIATEVAGVLDVGVLVTSTDGRERAAALDDAVRTRLAETQLVDPSGRFRVERASGRPLPFDDGEVRVLPVQAGRTEIARLVCVSPGRPLAPADVQALERAATVAALLVTRQQAVSAVENKYRGDFLRDVFLRRAGDESFVLEYAEGLGWDLDRPMLVVCAELDPPQPDEAGLPGAVRRGWQERFAAAWRQVCEAQDATIATADFATEVVTLVPLPHAGDGPDGARPRELVDRFVAAVAGDRGGGRRPFSAGVSRPVRSLAELPAGYEQARRATTVGRRISGGQSVTWFDDLGVHRLIALVPDSAELSRFAADVLGELAADTEEATQLRSTLQVLLDTNLNVAEAARLQYFHYNTMRYRLSKLERLLGPFTADPHLRLSLGVALQVLQLERPPSSRGGHN